MPNHAKSSQIMPNCIKLCQNNSIMQNIALLCHTMPTYPMIRSLICHGRNLFITLEPLDGFSHMRGHFAWFSYFGTIWYNLAWFGMVWHGLAWLVLVWHKWYEYMYAISSLNITKSKPNHTKPNQISWYGMVRHGLDQEGNFKPVLPLKIFENSAFMTQNKKKNQLFALLRALQGEIDDYLGISRILKTHFPTYWKLKSIRGQLFFLQPLLSKSCGSSHFLLSHFLTNSKTLWFLPRPKDSKMVRQSTVESKLTELWWKTVVAEIRV